jgi:hypothetical protein
MKITFGRIFETSLIAKTKSFKELQPLVEWLQQGIDNIARALTGGVNIANNLDAKIYSVRARSASASVTIEFRVDKQPVVLLLAKQFPVALPINSFTWQMLSNGNCQANLVFSSAPTVGVDVSLLAFYS